MRSGGDARRRCRPGYHAGRPLRNKGMHYPADPPTVEEVVAVMRQPLTTVTAGVCEQ
jgi:hypothetical protein